MLRQNYGLVIEKRVLRTIVGDTFALQLLQGRHLGSPRVNTCMLQFTILILVLNSCQSMLNFCRSIRLTAESIVWGICWTMSLYINCLVNGQWVLYRSLDAWAEVQIRKITMTATGRQLVINYGIVAWKTVVHHKPWPMLVVSVTDKYNGQWSVPDKRLVGRVSSLRHNKHNSYTVVV